MIAIDTWHSNPAKPDQLDYVHRDHIDAITDSNGSIVARRNFAPFGQCVKQRGGVIDNLFSQAGSLTTAMLNTNY